MRLEVLEKQPFDPFARRLSAPLYMCAALLFVPGCKVPGSKAGVTRVPARAILLDYSERIQRNLAQLVTLEASSTTSSLEIRHSLREHAQQFHEALVSYFKLLDEPDPGWSVAQASDVDRALDACQSLHAEMQESSLQLSLLSSTVQNLSKNAQKGTEGSPSQGGSKALKEYLGVCQDLSSLMSSIDNQLVTLHLRGMIPYSRVEHPAEGVFHFLRLYQLHSRNLDSHAHYYTSAWRGWLRSELKKHRVDSALAIFALAATSTTEYRPTALQKLSEIMNVSLENPPALDAVEKMEGSLARIRKAYDSGSRVSSQWTNGFRRATATLLLCRAYALDDPGQGIRLALQALELNSYLAEYVSNYLVKAAQALGGSLVAARKYLDGIEAFTRTISRGNVPDRETLTARYRNQIFQQAVFDSRRELEELRFADAREILAQVSAIARSSDEKQKLHEALYSYYHSYSTYLFQRDLQKAIAVCYEATQVFPSEIRARRNLDHGLYLLMQQKLGDLQTAHARLGAAKVLDLLKQTVGQMSTAEGSGACQKLLGDIERAWAKRLNRTTDPKEAYSLASELARLAGENTKAASRKGAQAIWRLLWHASGTQNWERVERCIDTYFAECPDIERPEEFQETYLRLLRHLDLKGDSKKLGRHIAIFTAAYPNEARSVKHLITKHVTTDNDVGKGFLELLKTVDPESGETTGWETGQPDGEEKVALDALIDTDELAHAELWWKEPSLDPTTGSLDTARVAAGWGLVVIGGVAGGGGSMVILVVLAVFTGRKGILPFRWYAFGAFWIGLSAGFLLGAR